MFYKITHHLVSMDQNLSLVLQTKTITRNTSPLHFQTFITRTDYYKCDCFPHKVTLWNSLPHSVVSVASLGHFFFWYRNWWTILWLTGVFFNTDDTASTSSSYWFINEPKYLSADGKPTLGMPHGLSWQLSVSMVSSGSCALWLLCRWKTGKLS